MYCVRFLAVRGTTVVAISDTLKFVSSEAYQEALQHNFYMNYMCCLDCFFCYDLQYFLTESSARTFLEWVEAWWGGGNDADVQFVPFLHVESAALLQPPFSLAAISSAAMYIFHGFQ